ncbi:MAG: lamin tail domain-containing protein, partial [bacterium]|nr:lamin tail domain-containing protein [bacterium]
MENRRIITFSFLVVFGGLIAIIPFLGNGYDDKTTHPTLTQEIVKFYNQSFPQKQIGREEMELVIKGSVEEDYFGRWMRHFYDPVHKRGLNFLGKEWQSSKDWAKDTLAQATYKIQDIGQKTLYGKVKDIFSGETDYSWDRAVYEYTWGDKKRAFESLGHTLHLLEDAAVPDHTRNDPHPGIGSVVKDTLSGFAPEWILSKFEHSHSLNSSPYESFAKFNRDNTDIVSQLKNKKLFLVSSPDEAIEKMATYSNKNFFSGDTILTKYTYPNIDFYKELGLASDKIVLGINFVDGEEVNLVRMQKSIDVKTGSIISTYSLKDPKDIVLSNYWSLLSKQAVLHGAGVIKLFFDEVEKEKQNKVLYEKNKSWLTKKLASIISGKNNNSDSKEIASSLGGLGTRLPTGQADNDNPPSLASKPLEAKLGATAIKEKPKSAEVILASQKPAAPILPVQLPSPPSIQPPPAPKHISKDTSDQLPIAGAGGGSSSTNSQADTTPPSAPVISSPTENYISSSTSLAFSGTAETNSNINQTFNGLTSSVTNLGSWILNLTNLLQGTSTINFYATDSAGNKSSGAARTFFIDSTSPSASLTVSECSSSLSADACLVATSTVNVSWSSAASDLDHYIVECEKSGAACASFPNLLNTTSTSTTYTLPTDNSSYTFKSKAVDIYGNVSSQQTQVVELATRPLVINEIAWAGTSAARASDEWIEIFNPTSRTINLASTTLVSETDGNPDIELSGTLASKAYYLIERNDDNTISDITASSTVSFSSGLNNSGEVLALKKGSAVFDRTPTVASCGGWCGGSNSGSYPTMERYDFEANGESSGNWSSYAGILANGKNADNVNIAGTPGKRNSINYFLDVTGSSLGASKTIKKSNSPYLITSEFTVQSGATMTVEPGVVIKFYNTSSSLKINGALNAAGTSAENIVFTSFKDDTYAGDTNADGTNTSPTAGDWASIKILAAGSIIDRSVIK